MTRSGAGVAVPEESNWQEARLIPTSGISGPDEAERRATSALLSVMGAVREFGMAMVKPLGAPAGQLVTYIETPFKLKDRSCQPDGLLRTSRAGRTWTCLVEVKTGAAELERAQVETYLDVARENGFDCVLTISNQLAPASDVHPVDVDKRKLRKVALHHVSWAEVVTIAIQQRVHRGVSDPDQAWILGELIRYLEHPKSGALDFSDMGGAWVTVRESVAAGTLRSNDKGLPDVVSRWEQLLRFAALRLGRELAADVQVAMSRRELADPTVRFAAQAQSLVANGTLAGSLRISDAVAPIDVVADLRSGRVTVSIDVEAPRDGRAATRINWLTRQLKDAPDGLRIDAFTTGSRSSTSELLRTVREDSNVLIEDPKKEFRSFRVAATSPLGTKRGTGRGGFIDSVLAAVDGFYGAVVQQVRPWAAKAPQLRPTGRSAVEEAGIDTQPPTADLAEEVEADLVPPPETDVEPAAIRDAIETVDPAEVQVDALPQPTGSIADEFVSWDDAQDRLDHEREADSPKTASTE